LPRGSQFDKKMMTGQKKVRGETARHIAFFVPFDGKRARLVLPLDVIEVEYSRKLRFGLVSEADWMPSGNFGLVVIAKILLQYGNRSLELGQQRRRDFNRLFGSRNPSRGVLLLYDDELMAIALGYLYRDFGAGTDAETAYFIGSLFKLRGHNKPCSNRTQILLARSAPAEGAARAPIVPGLRLNI
jgi:hypothetical protein